MKRAWLDQWDLAVCKGSCVVGKEKDHARTLKWLVQHGSMFDNRRYLFIWREMSWEPAAFIHPPRLSCIVNLYDIQMVEKGVLIFTLKITMTPMQGGNWKPREGIYDYITSQGDTQ